MRMSRTLPLLLLLLVSLGACATRRPSRSPRLSVKVVVVAMFELGADTGDAPGEYQFWVEREHLDQVLPFPAGNRDLRMNSNGVLARAYRRRHRQGGRDDHGAGTRSALRSVQGVLGGRRNCRGGSGQEPRSARRCGRTTLSTAILDMRSTRARFPPTGRPAIFRWAKNRPSSLRRRRSRVSSTSSIPRSWSGLTG